MPVQFTGDLLTGIERIDNQHREWFKRLDHFWRAAKNNRSNDEIIETLVFLQEYVKTHFKDEEQIQLEISYPGYQTQKKQHNDYLEEIEYLVDSLQRKGPEFSITIDTLNSMLEWVVKHITILDKDLADFIKNRQNEKSLKPDKSIAK